MCNNIMIPLNVVDFEMIMFAEANYVLGGVYLGVKLYLPFNLVTYVF